MANFSSYFSLNRMALALTIGSFTSVTALPASNYQMQIGLNDVAAGVRIGKLLEKAKKNFEKGLFFKEKAFLKPTQRVGL